MDQPKILLVDDDPHVRKLISLYLRDLDATVVEAGNGEEAMERIDEEDFEVALIDLILPYFGGFRLCRRLKERNSEAFIVIITADDSMETRETAKQCGADEFIGKPLDAGNIRGIVQQALDRARVS